MKHPFIYAALGLLLAATGCGNHPMQNLAMDLVLVSPPQGDTKNPLYPSDLKALTQPMENVCSPQADLALYPLNLKRVDLDKHLPLDYESNRATNYQKIKAIQRGWKNFFENTRPPAWLYQPSNDNFDLNAFLRQNTHSANVFILTEHPGTVPGAKCFDNVPDLRAAIAEFACSLEKKNARIVVIYQPALGGATSMVGNHPEEKAVNRIVTDQPEQATALPVKRSLRSVPGGDLQTNMQRLVGGSLNAEEKELLKQSIERTFEPDAKAYLFKGTQMTRVQRIQGYLESLIVTPKNISRNILIDSIKKFEDHKIYDIYIHETTAEIQ